MTPFSLNIHGTLRCFERPVVMGIVNATPDSFHPQSRHEASADAADTAAAMVAAGATIIDVGAYSTRPGAAVVAADEEYRRLADVLPAIRTAVGPDVLISVDTFRASIAREAVEVWGADIINDVSGGEADEEMVATIAALRCPYVLMHMRGTPADMNTLTDYPAGVVAEVVGYISRRAAALHADGVADIIVDPGFGFAKTLGQNYALLDALPLLAAAGMPVLAGLSRKSMLSRLPGVASEAIVAATTAANVLAVERGAAIVRVHDVAEAVAALSVINALHSHI